MNFFDTCALLDLQKEAFNECFLLSSTTLTELESIKSSGTKDEETKWKARQILHLLANNEDKYQVFIPQKVEKFIRKFKLPQNNDSSIICTAYQCYKKFDTKLVFVTSDLACRELAKVVGLQTRFTFVDDNDEYTGYKEVKMSNDQLAIFYSKILIENENIYNLKINEYLLIIDNSGAIIDKYKWTAEGYKKIGFCKAESKMFGKIVPYNNDPYQQIALDSLASNQITMLRGRAGTGKSYLSFGYMFNLLETGKVSKVVIFCNTVATKGSAKLGYYPGSRTEKLLDSQIGNLLESKLGDKMIVEDLIDKGKLVLLPLSDIRGYDTTGMNAAIYLSEAQNLDIELMRLALQRIGSDSICIIDGDDKAQVDLSMYAGSHNGMKRASKVFRGESCYGEVELKNIYRSDIAKIAERM